MSVKINPGFAICNGCLKLEENARTLSIAKADSDYSRIDTVVLRLDNNVSERNCEFYVVAGTPAASPVQPVLTRNETVWELGLANLLIRKGTTKLGNSYITDTRLDSERCGVISSISEFDTSALYQQIQADLAEFQENEQAEFAVWFEEIKNQLSGDAAGNLQVQIEVERQRVNNLIRMEEGSTTGDAELQDIRVGADGITYSTAGEAVRRQFENLTENCSNTNAELQDVKVGFDGVSYETAGNATREQFRRISEYAVLRTVKMNDSEMMLGTYISTTRIGVGLDINFLEYAQKSGMCLCRHIQVKQGDEFVLVENVNLNATENSFIIVADSNMIITRIINFSEINSKRRFVFEEDGCFLFCFEYNLSASEEVFRIERPGRFKPFVLYEEKSIDYLENPLIGDQVMEAILAGRQILVRVPNADGGKHTAVYSPVYMYQLPNYENEYLYLFYLKDEKQDLSNVIGYPIQMPVYGELKLLLSKTYNATPLV